MKYTVEITFLNREPKTFTSFNAPHALAIYRYYFPGKILHQGVSVISSKLSVNGL